MNTCTDRDHTEFRHHWGMCVTCTADDACVCDMCRDAAVMASPSHVYEGATVSAEFWGGAVRVGTVVSAGSRGMAKVRFADGKIVSKCIFSLFAV